MDEDVSAFCVENKRKRKLWQDAVEELIVPRSSDCVKNTAKHARSSAIKDFISSIWKLGCARVLPEKRKRLRYHDFWHNLCDRRENVKEEPENRQLQYATKMTHNTSAEFDKLFMPVNEAREGDEFHATQYIVDMVDF